MESAGQHITIWSLFLEADPVVKGVMLILALASIWSWAIAVDKWLQFGELDSQARKFERQFWSGRSMDDAEEGGDRARDALSRVYASAVREWRETRRAGSGEDATLMLARVDGKSPVEYLSAGEQQLVRDIAMPLVASPVRHVDEVLARMQAHLVSVGENR